MTIERQEQLEGLNGISINFGEGGMMIVNIILAFVMFGVALGIKPHTFKDVFANPKSVILGILLQWVGLPAVTFLIALILNPVITPMIALGMILVASCPGGNISNFVSSLSKGNIELSVSMTAITTAFAPFITPLNFYFWGNLYSQIISVRNDIPMLVIPFLPMLEQIMLLLGVPIVLGLIFAHYFPNATKKITKPTQILSIALFIGMASGIITLGIISCRVAIPAGRNGIFPTTIPTAYNTIIGPRRPSNGNLWHAHITPAGATHRKTVYTIYSQTVIISFF